MANNSVSTRDACAKGSYYYFFPAQLTHPPKGHDLYDPRSEAPPDEQLMALMREHGWAGPPMQVVPEDGQLLIADGRRRHRAAEALKKAGVDIRCKAEIAKVEGFDSMLVGNLGRREEEPIQLAHKAQRLVNRGLSIKEIAKKFGVTEPTIRNYLELAAAPADVKAAVKAGEVTPTIAREIARKPASERAEILTEAKEKPKALKGAAGKARVKSGARAPSGKIPAAVLRAVADPEKSKGASAEIKRFAQIVRYLLTGDRGEVTPAIVEFVEGLS